MPFCTKCGELVEEDDLFCSRCGCNLQGQGNSVSELEIINNNYVKSDSRDSEQPITTQMNQEKGSKITRNLMIFAVIVLSTIILTAVIETMTSTVRLPLPLPELGVNWERFTIENVGSIDIPPTMELQEGDYKLFVNEIKQKVLKMEQQDNTITFQPVGVNETFRSLRYARIMLATETGDYDFTLDFNIKQFTETDIYDLNKILREQYVATLPFIPGMKLLEWYPLKVEKLNGMSCVHTSYKRQLNNNAPVIVHEYQFQNIDMSHKLTLSYRETEKEYFLNDFDKVLASLRLNKRR